MNSNQLASKLIDTIKTNYPEALNDVEYSHIYDIWLPIIKQALGEFVKVTSSNISEIAFKDDKLTVRFSSGGIYKYLDVEEEVFQEFLESESKGKFLARRIKGKYNFIKI